MSRRPLLSRPSIRGAAALTVALLAAGLALAAPAAADQLPTATVGDVTVNEGDAGTTSAVFAVTLTQPSRNPITLSWYTTDGSARAPGDYTAGGGQLVFAPGTTSQTVSVDVVGDTKYEGDEYFSLVISSPGGVTIPDATGIGTIVDDDPRPYVSAGNATVLEGDTGTVAAVFPITLDRASANDVRVRYQTADGTARAPSDYTYTQGTLTIPAGQTSASVTVPVIGDTRDEGASEYFQLDLSSPSGVQLFGDSDGIATIVDDDSTPALSVTDAAVYEGNSGTKSMNFTVKLLNASPNTVTATYATSDGTATAGADYTSTRGTLTFAPGEVLKTVTVPIIGDTLDEGLGEYFQFNIGAVSGAYAQDGSAYGNIEDDDGTDGNRGPLLTVDSTTVKEGDSGKAIATFTVQLQPASGGTVTVQYSTSGGSATSGVDFTAKSGTLSIPAGSTTATVQVAVTGDTTIEDDEQFFLNLATPSSNANIDDPSGTGIILDDDVPPQVSVSDTTVTEGDTGTADAAFTISLSAASPLTTSVVYSSNNYNATAPGDYTTVSGTATFQPGQTSKVIHVPVIGDRIDENDEQFYVYLSSPSNLKVTDNYGWGVIIDDDRNPSISVDDGSLYEGTTGTVKAVFTVRLSAASANTVTVNYGTSNGTATAPDDFTAASGTLSFTPGQTAKTVAVTVQSDSLQENNEYFYLFVNTPTNATLQDDTGVMYILDDDSNPGVSVDDQSIVEPDSATAVMTFHVTLSAPSLNTATVNFDTSDGTAGSATDYTAKSGTLTFAPGDTTKTVSITIKGDTIHEADEYFYLNLRSPSNAYVLDSYGYGTIIDNDRLPNLAIDESGVIEGNSGSKNGTFTVTLQPASVNTVTVAYTTNDGTATAGSDYSTTAGSLTFAPGETSKTIPVPVLGDTVAENNEYFSMSLSGATNAAVLDGVGYVTIFNDDPSGGGSIISVNDATVVEKDSGTTNAVFSVKLSPPATSPVTVNYRTSDNNAAADVDYVPQAGTLTFAPGATTATVTVPVKGDRLVEADESFSVVLSELNGPANYGESSAYGVILDNDVTPLVAIDDVTVDEGGPGTTTDAAFTIRLLQASPQPAWVDWQTTDGNAVAPGDYLDDSGTVYFAPGETSKVVDVTVNGDDVVEGDEGFHVDLSNPVGARYGTSKTRGEGVILDSDAYAVLGTVNLTTGGGASGTTLTLAGNAQPTRTTTSGSSGAFSFEDVPDGRYTVTPSATGRVFAPASSTVTVRGGAATGFTFLSMKSPAVSGRILTGAGDPAAGVVVTRSGNSQPAVTTTTNGQGYYGFSANPTGTYTITPTSTGTYSPASTSVTLSATSAVTANFTKS